MRWIICDEYEGVLVLSRLYYKIKSIISVRSVPFIKCPNGFHDLSNKLIFVSAISNNLIPCKTERSEIFLICLGMCGGPNSKIVRNY